MYHFNSLAEVKDAVENPYITSDLDMFVTSLGSDVKIIFSAQYFKHILSIPGGEEWFVSALKELVGFLKEEDNGLREHRAVGFAIDAIKYHIGTFGLWGRGDDNE